MNTFQQDIYQQTPYITNHYTQIELTICKEFLNQIKSKQASLQQIQIIKQQNQLLKLIKQKMDVNTSRIEHFLTQSDQYKQTLSQLQKYNQQSHTCAGSSSFITLTNRSIFSAESTKIKRKGIIDLDDIQDSLREVNEKCSQQTYDTINKFVKQFKNQRQRLKDSKLIESQYDKLKRQYMVFKSRYDQQCQVLKKLQTNLKLLEQQKRRAEKNVSQKQRNIIKKEKSLLIKQRMINQDLKKLNSKYQTLTKKQKIIEQDRISTQTIWENILQKLQQERQIDNQFKNNVFKRCKQSLTNQRKFIMEQQEQLDQQHVFIQKMLNQLKGN